MKSHNALVELEDIRYGIDEIFDSNDDLREQAQKLQDMYQQIITEQDEMESSMEHLQAMRHQQQMAAKNDQDDILLKNKVQKSQQVGTRQRRNSRQLSQPQNVNIHPVASSAEEKLIVRSNIRKSSNNAGTANNNNNNQHKLHTIEDQNSSMNNSSQKNSDKRSRNSSSRSPKNTDGKQFFMTKQQTRDSLPENYNINIVHEINKIKEKDNFLQLIQRNDPIVKSIFEEVDQHYQQQLLDQQIVKRNPYFNRLLQLEPIREKNITPHETEMQQRLRQQSIISSMNSFLIGSGSGGHSQQTPQIHQLSKFLKIQQPSNLSSHSMMQGVGSNIENSINPNIVSQENLYQKYQLDKRLAQGEVIFQDIDLYGFDQIKEWLHYFPEYNFSQFSQKPTFQKYFSSKDGIEESIQLAQSSIDKKDFFTRKSSANHSQRLMESPSITKRSAFTKTIVQTQKELDKDSNSLQLHKIDSDRLYLEQSSLDISRNQTNSPNKKKQIYNTQPLLQQQTTRIDSGKTQRHRNSTILEQSDRSILAPGLKSLRNSHIACIDQHNNQQ